MPDEEIINSSRSATPLPLMASEQVLFLVRPSFIITFFLILSLLLTGAAFLWILIFFNILNIIKIISPTIIITIYIAVFLFVALVIFLAWLNTEYVLTTKRVEIRSGIIGTGTISIALDKIQNVSVNIGIIGWVLNYGNVRIEPAGLTNSINFNNITSPKLRREQIEAAMGQ